MTIGARIGEARQLLGLSRMALGEKLSVDVKTVWRWENDRAKPEADAIAPLAAALNASLEWLLTGEGEGPTIIAKSSAGEAA